MLHINKHSGKIASGETQLFLVSKIFKNALLSKEENEFVNNFLFKDENSWMEINRLSHKLFFCKIDTKKKDNAHLESIRKSAVDAFAKLNANKKESIIIIDETLSSLHLNTFLEGLCLSSYQFLKYKSDKAKKENKFKNIQLVSKLTTKEIDVLNIINRAVFKTRDLVNEPVSYLTAEQLALEISLMGKEAGFKVEVLNKKKIEALKMGGLLAVNKGSQDPPTFSIIEYKASRPKNKKPIVLVGKGVVYDTGGLSLKPTPNSMDQMKSDMAGAAAVAGTLYAIAQMKLPLHVIGLIPATDNRPGETAYTPGDVVTMHNGSTVEVLNTDAEGRMILADALSYAKQYDPELVVDLATLTGAAIVAVGNIAIAAMGNTKTLEKFKQSGMNTHERIVELPLWEEYGEMIKSEIADIKNIGGAGAGSITAGKFLEKFTSYSWIHLDIAGPSFLMAKDSYRGQGGTGVGVRLLVDYFKNY